MSYDAIVVGARCAGAATALLLARRGLQVLVVDQQREGRDTLSTHVLLHAGVVQLSRWGLLDALAAQGTPALRGSTFHYRFPDDEASETVDVRPAGGVDALYAPRRTVLDPLLVDAARRAGAEVRFGTKVERLLVDRAGRVRVVPWTHAHRAVLALLAVVLLSQGLSVKDNAHVLSTWYYPSRDVLAGPQEQGLLRRLDSLVPAGSVVAGSPWNGAALGQALSHRQVLYPHMLGHWGTDGTLLANQLVDASGDRAVCAAARRLHVGYVLDGPSAFWVTDPRQRWYAGLHVAGAPGFQPVATGGRLTLYRLTACGS